MLLGVVLLLTPGNGWTARLAIGAALGIIQILGVAKGGIRAIVAHEGFEEKCASCYWTLAPIVPWVMLYNFLLAGFVRRIEWRGTEYELISQSEVRVLGRR